jgi:hypothetical protein
MITEKIQDNTHVGNNGNIVGAMFYTYHSPQTHWSADGLCAIKANFRGDNKPPIVTLSYGAGGCLAEATSIQIAEAMSEAFARAQSRLEVLSRLEAMWNKSLA